ncbi:MAG: carbamoyltransferase [Acidobacteria bacterium]|nr:carbamoyltransferase [Acidobacteriota bacterium]
MPEATSPNILGVSASSHDAAAALLQGGRMVAAIEEEKLSRVRRTHGLPQQAIRYCLDQAGLRAADIQFVSVARPLRDRARGSQSAETWIPAWLKTEFSSAKVILVDHHACHAAAAFYPSPFDRALVLVLDESGDGKSASLSLGSGLDIEPLSDATFPDSLGNLFSRVAALAVFASFGEEHKLQWLSTAGTPRYAQVFRNILAMQPGALLSVDQSYLLAGEGARGGFAGKFFEACELPLSGEFTEIQRVDLAASLQLVVNETVELLVGAHLQRTESENLCLGGGVALNSLLISHLESSTKFGGVFVQPAAGNAGNAVGAALHCAHTHLRLASRTPLDHLFFGPEFSDEAIKDVLENSKLSFRYLPQRKDIITAAVDVLKGDRILGWFQGRAEFGPRALGARSILASPLGQYVNENLNQYVKHREKYRPFAAAVPEESASEYFEFSGSARFLTSVGRVKQKHLDRFASNLLVTQSEPGSTEGTMENRIRVQIVNKTSNRYLWDLLDAFGKATGVPVLFNTSFNLFGEPMVCSPRDAIRSFYCSGLDHLMIGPFSLAK